MLAAQRTTSRSSSGEFTTPMSTAAKFFAEGGVGKSDSGRDYERHLVSHKPVTTDSSASTTSRMYDAGVIYRMMIVCSYFGKCGAVSLVLCVTQGDLCIHFA